MITPEQIPDEVMAAFNDAWFNQGLTTRECLAAAITLVRKATLEEAAKVAEGLYQQGQIGGDIAAAIRKLGEE